MKLRLKVFLVLACIWAIISLVIYIDAKITLEADYHRLEIKLADREINRVQKAIENRLTTLRLYTTPFSQWDDTYAFMANKNDHYILSNFVPGTFTSSKINFFLLYDTAGNFYDGRAFNLNQKTFEPIPPSLLAALNQNKAFITHTDIHSCKIGILNTAEGEIALSSMPILTSDGEGPIRGTVLIGYAITPAFFETLSQTVNLKLNYFPLSVVQSKEALYEAYENTLADEQWVAFKNTQLAFGYFPLKDVAEKPIGLVRIELPRDFYNQGLLTIHHYLIIIIIAGLILLFAMMYLLKILVLDRIIIVGKKVVDINHEGKFDQRIPVTGSDEIHSMAMAINNMLELINLTQDQLKYRISKRTRELEKISHLNQELFDEMGKQKNIEAKLRDDEKFLRQIAYYDSLTGLPNRALFNELSNQALNRAEHDNKVAALLFFDVDKFKKINDTYGHETGDKFLKFLAQRIKDELSETDLMAHFSGDEFILLLTSIDDQESINQFISKLFASLSDNPIKVDHLTLNPTYSIGISLYPEDSQTVEELLSQADLAMYYAKKQEGNAFRYYGAIKDFRTTLPTY